MSEKERSHKYPSHYSKEVVVRYSHGRAAISPGTDITRMPNHLLASKTAAITGGTTGIGRAIALEYLRQGANVAINHLDLPSDQHHKESVIAEAKAIKEADGEAGSLIEVAGDVTNPETGVKLVEEAVKQFGGLDIFVSNAGVCKFAEFLEYVLRRSPVQQLPI